MNYQQIINEIYQKAKNKPDTGVVASYIPELGKVHPDNFGICLKTIEGECFGVGDFQKKFSIQSISKVLTFTLALKILGAELWKRVGMEPSGDPFNSLVQLEVENGTPRNPLINSGAIVVCDVLISHLKNPKQELLAFVRKLADNSQINYTKKVVDSEKSFGFKNTAHANLIKSFGNIENDIDQVLDLYYHACSLEMTCKEVSDVFLYLANGGVSPHTNETIISLGRSKRINATIQLCGLYDEAGEFAFKVGLPGKSGVGGGIVAIHPGKYCIAVWSPKLNNKGNSKKGFKVLELFTTATELSIY